MLPKIAEDDSLLEEDADSPTDTLVVLETVVASVDVADSVAVRA